MNNNQIKNMTCWITGASSGIGAALAVKLNKSGANLILSSRNQRLLEELKQNCDFPERVKIMVCDMEKTETLATAAGEAWKIFNGIDYVFLNAGIAVRDMAMNTDLTMVKKVMNVNFFSNTEISKTLLPWMIKSGHGHFVVTSSLCGKFGVPKLSAYAASKHALHGYYESLRAEHGNQGIKVTMVTAGLVKTNITMNALKGDGTLYGKMQESIANGIEPEKCARLIVRAVLEKRREVLVGGIEKYAVLLKRFFPGVHSYVIDKHPLKKWRDLVFAKEALSRFLFDKNKKRVLKNAAITNIIG